MAEVAAVVLAAGRATRFGAGPDDSKVFALLDGKPLVAHVIVAARASQASPVIVVTGHAPARADALLGRDASVTLVRNPDHALGLSTSLRVGLAALSDAVDGALILLGDMPLVASRTLDHLINAFARERPEAVVPIFDRRWGNPILIDRSLFAPVMALCGDRGARKLLEAPGRWVVECVVDDPHVLTDIDTRETLAMLGGETP